ncbi:MAG: YkgJ family cysteine cluster protein, partial [Lachnospiraceae bacterium]|nr:YkgJ family cysteine cluster protein [Lachnospiraceae bacterium]
DGTFDYFLQVHECPREPKTEVLVKDWIGINEIDAYEAFIRAWHDISDSVKALSGINDDRALKSANMKLLNEYYIKPYDTTRDFFSQFYSRGI